MPCTQACPPAHWLFAVHALQAPAMQARPEGLWLGSSGLVVLQSAYVVHAAHTPERHACPLVQSARDWHAPQNEPFTHPSPGWQSAAVEHSHDPLEQVAVGPHWLPDVHAPQTPAVQTLPASQSPFDVQAGVQIPEAHASPEAQSLVTEQVHSNVVWVAVHTALGPHWPSDAHRPHVPPEQTWPAAH